MGGEDAGQSGFSLADRARDVGGSKFARANELYKLFGLFRGDLEAIIGYARLFLQGTEESRGNEDAKQQAYELLNGIKAYFCEQVLMYPTGVEMLAAKAKEIVPKFESGMARVFERREPEGIEEMDTAYRLIWGP
ncbi:hypothetical protein HYY70_00820 [Candidatus Woesearchaeota archaeon]|nr:hypothetical protein [Candidatus Woesearchaeota archaeon]